MNCEKIPDESPIFGKSTLFNSSVKNKRWTKIETKKCKRRWKTKKFSIKMIDLLFQKSKKFSTFEKYSTFLSIKRECKIRGDHSNQIGTNYLRTQE